MNELWNVVAEVGDGGGGVKLSDKRTVKVKIIIIIIKSLPTSTPIQIIPGNSSSGSKTILR